MYLVDSSVWIAVFRKRAPVDLAGVISLEEVVTCLPVIQEVLQGFGDERAYRLAHAAMLAFPVVDSPLVAARFEEAVELYRAARRRGLTVRSSVDCLVAASALRHDLTVLHVDRDYEELAAVSALKHARLP